MPVEIPLLLILILCNGFFALSEMALVTARKSRLKRDADKSAAARAALKLALQPERFLSAVQVYITLLTMLTGALIGERFGQSLAGVISLLPLGMFAAYLEQISFALTFFAVTLVSIVLGELIPKRAALVAPERIAELVAVPMSVLAMLAAPVVYLLSTLVSFVLKVFRLDRATSEKITEEEIRLLVAESAEQGIIDQVEQQMVNRVLRLGDRPVAGIMTPRTQIAWLDTAATLEENLSVMRDTPYSRYPVMRGNDQEVVGVVEVKRLIDFLQNPTQQVDLFRKLAKPLFVPEIMSAVAVLEELRDAEVNAVFVVDEYGDLQGFVTLGDMLDAVVGRSSADETAADASIVRRDDGSFLVDGALGIDDLKDLLQVDQLPHEADHDFHTLAGMMIAQFGRVPAVADHFEWTVFRFEVMDLDGARVDKVLVSRLD